MGTDLDNLGQNQGKKNLELGKSNEDVEEGEISESVLLDEIGKKKEDSKAGLVLNNESVREISRVWTMRDIHNYQVSRNYGSGFYNLAWAQAVQNKPLNDVFNDHKSNETSKSGGNNDKPINEVENSEEINKLVIDLSSGGDDDDDKSEKEEGELEEGEIDFNVIDLDVSKSENNLKGSKKTLEERVEAIREALESVITNDSEVSFDMVCLRIKDSLDSLWEVILEDFGSNIDELVKLAFRAINTLNIMLGSMKQEQREQHKESLSRLFHHVTTQNPPLFSTEQIKEIEHLILFLNSGAPSPSLESISNQTKIEKIEEEKTTMDFTKLETTSFKNRGKLLPLLDLHKDHDEDSLPSPTRDAPTVMPPSNDVAPRSSVIKPLEVAIPYFETDANNAISTYQQKFGRTSFHMSDLPSPTPSEDGDKMINETGGEVSSSFGVRVETATTPNLPQANIPSSCVMDISSSVGAPAPSLPHLNVSTSSAMDISTSHAVNYTTNIVPVKSSAKSRDPRRRFANKDTGVSRVSNIDSYGKTTEAKRQKPTHEPVSDERILKRQKNEPTEIGSVVNSSSGVNNIVNVISNGFDNLRGATTSNGFPLDSLLKDIAMNPALYMNLIKMEQQKAVDPVKNFTHLSSSNGAIETIPSVNVTLSKPLVVLQKPAEVLQITPQTASKDESEKIRMKPRDPRRALHTNKVQKVGNSGSNHSITSTSISSSQENRVGLNSCSQPDRNVPAIKNLTVPGITRQFTNNIKDSADMVSVSQTPIGLPVNNQDGTISSPEEPSASPCQSQNAWGEVEHLFVGLDEKQKVAFRNERARRIDEQKKMFSARKLCLVLDLDHTLLNSAKFVEVDPVHDEILRKKEEQDREKPHRHLFRFPHMGMWTKLRPGIWNFLEKASKLFEMHLYTMGNKLYATEMAKLLDPNGTLFSGRVISRGDDGDDGDISKSKDLDGVLGMESGVVIIDDSIRVWPHNKLNLIVVERYIYFPCSRRQFGLLGPSLLEIDHDERPEAGTLASSLAVIERIHQNFFAHRSLDEADVRNILASEQRRILGGCRILFSRVFPVGESSPNLHPLWQTAEQFGAVCTNQMDDQVTHVVANSLGTDKVNWALKHDRFVVHPGWVEASALLYRRANEQDFAIKL